MYIVKQRDVGRRSLAWICLCDAACAAHGACTDLVAYGADLDYGGTESGV